MLKSSIETYGSVNDPNLLYYNLDLFNNRSVDTGASGDPIIRFNESRSTPILRDASKYEFSIVRFSLSCTGDLPLFIPQIMTGQSDVNKTIYSITLSASVGGGATVTAQEYIIFESESASGSGIVTPSEPLVSQQKSKYYWVYTYNHWVYLVNKTFQKCIDNLNTQLGVPLTTKAPYLMYDPITGLFSIYADSNGFGSTTTTEQLKIYFNSNMFGLFTNFDNTYYGQDIDGKNNMIIVANKLGKNIYSYDSVNYYVMTQDWESTSKIWSPIKSLVFCSSILPINSELTGVPLTFGDNNVTSSSTSSSNFAPIVTDITVSGQANEWKTGIVYVPAGEYRMCSLTGGEIRQTDIQVYWKDAQGELIAMTMPNGSSVNMKLMFRKKCQI